jgi:hypothetical protein
MPDEIMAVNERLTRLEVTVATGFSELRAEIGAKTSGLEDRLRADIGAKTSGVEDRLRNEIGAKTSSLESRLRVLIEASRDEQRLAAEGLGAALDRIEARLTQMHEEYVQTRNDHASALQDHDRRIGALERRQSDSAPAI